MNAPGSSSLSPQRREHPSLRNPGQVVVYACGCGGSVACRVADRGLVPGRVDCPYRCGEYAELVAGAVPVVEPTLELWRPVGSKAVREVCRRVPNQHRAGLREVLRRGYLIVRARV